MKFFKKLIEGCEEFLIIFACIIYMYSVLLYKLTLDYFQNKTIPLLVSIIIILIILSSSIFLEVQINKGILKKIEHKEILKSLLWLTVLVVIVTITFLTGKTMWT